MGYCILYIIITLHYYLRQNVLPTNIFLSVPNDKNLPDLSADEDPPPTSPSTLPQKYNIFNIKRLCSARESSARVVILSLRPTIFLPHSNTRLGKRVGGNTPLLLIIIKKKGEREEMKRAVLQEEVQT